MSHVGVNGLGGTLAPGNAGNAMATAKCLAGSLEGEEAPAQNPGVSPARPGCLQEPPAETSGWRRCRSRNKLSPSGLAWVGGETTVVFQVLLVKVGTRPCRTQMGIPTVFTWSLSPSRL